MQSTRNIMRSPHVCRIVKSSPSFARQASFLAPSAFHRFPSGPFGIGNDFAPLFRLMDDITTPRGFDFSPFNFQVQARQSWQPRFDVQQVDNAYELTGELPGVESNNLEVEFTDEQTLVVRGRTASESTQGDPEMSGALQQTEQAATETTQAAVDNTDAISEKSTSSYVKPSVEDEATGEISSAGESTPAETPATEQPAQEQQQQPQKQNNTRYWVSERRVGSFQRTFNFPSRVDQEGVKASLKNGILNITVPLAAAPSTKKINVE